MYKIKNNSDGFTNHLLFIAILVGVIGLISFSGRKVWVANTKATNVAVVTSRDTPGSTTNTGTPIDAPSKGARKVSIKKTGTAAAVVQQAGGTPSDPISTPVEPVVVTTPYPTTSPQGSLNQLIRELKSQNFKNALLFITPAFMARTAALIQTQQQYVTLDACKANSTCLALLNTPVNVLAAADKVVHHTSSGTSSEQILTYFIGFRNNTYVSDLDKLSGDYTIVINMVPATEHWLIDKVTVNGIEI